MKITIETDRKKKEQKKKEYSKSIVAWMIIPLFIMVYCFIIFCCYMIFRTNDLSPITYIAPAILGAFAAICCITVKWYMWRAKQKDYVQLDIEKNKMLSRMKKEFGDDFVYQETREVETPDYNG